MIALINSRLEDKTQAKSQVTQLEEIQVKALKAKLVMWTKERIVLEQMETTVSEEALMVGEMAHKIEYWN